MVTIDEIATFLSSDAKDPDEQLLRPGCVVGSWQVLSYLGGGGSGEVYRVRHTLLGIVCALKILSKVSEGAYKRFVQESIFVAQHSDLAVPRFYEFGTFEHRPYYVMEMLVAQELPTGDRRVAVLMRRLCEQLSLIHDCGIVHRDIKPSNVLYRKNGDIVFVDFGLIKKLPRERGAHHVPSNLTQVNMAVGTERYAAPEQLVGQPVDVQADIHALGVFIDACFHGLIPCRWKRIVCRATSSLPEQRYSSCREMARAIAFRFLPEIIVLAAIMLLLLGLAVYVFTPQPQDIELSTRVHCDAPIRAAVDEVNLKNVSESAGDWL